MSFKAFLSFTSINISSCFFSDPRNDTSVIFGHLEFSDIWPLAILSTSELLAIPHILGDVRNFVLPFFFLILFCEYLSLAGKMPPPP